MSDDFTPTIYLKDGCPFSFKLRVFLLEAGLIDQVRLVTFAAETPEEDAVQAELGPHFDKVTFPSAEVEPGKFQNDSDGLIDWFANRHKLDPATMPTLQAYINGPFKNIGRLFRENRELKQAMV